MSLLSIIYYQKTIKLQISHSANANKTQTFPSTFTNAPFEHLSSLLQITSTTCPAPSNCGFSTLSPTNSPSSAPAKGFILPPFKKFNTSTHFSWGRSSNLQYGSFTCYLMTSPLAKNGEKFSFKVFLSLFAKASNIFPNKASISLMYWAFFNTNWRYLASYFCNLLSYLPFLNSPSQLLPWLSIKVPAPCIKWPSQSPS